MAAQLTAAPRHSYGLYSYGVYSYGGTWFCGLFSQSVCRAEHTKYLCSHGLYCYGRRSTYVVMAYIVMADKVAAGFTLNGHSGREVAAAGFTLNGRNGRSRCRGHAQRTRRKGGTGRRRRASAPSCRPISPRSRPRSPPSPGAFSCWLYLGIADGMPIARVWARRYSKWPSLRSPRRSF